MEITSRVQTPDSEQYHNIGIRGRGSSTLNAHSGAVGKLTIVRIVDFCVSPDARGKWHQVFQKDSQSRRSVNNVVARQGNYISTRLAI